jgi:hypothetical protein
VSWRTALGVLVAAAALAPAGPAGWSMSAGGSGVAGAKTMPAGNTPSGSVSGNSVTVSWSATTFSDGGAVAGYVVKRYNAITGAPAAVGAACSGIVAATSCTETGVAIGSWKYSVTPAHGNWRGAESGQSTTVIVLV